MTYTDVYSNITLIEMQGPPITTAQQFLDIMMNAPTDNLIIHQNDLSESFFDLKSGMAGSILQKVANYRWRLVIVGDFSGYESKSLKAFIYESNKGTIANFVGSVKEGVEKLK